MYFGGKIDYVDNVYRRLIIDIYIYIMLRVSLFFCVLFCCCLPLPVFLSLVVLPLLPCFALLCCGPNVFAKRSGFFINVLLRADVSRPSWTFQLGLIYLSIYLSIYLFQHFCFSNFWKRNYILRYVHIYRNRLWISWKYSKHQYDETRNQFI